MNTLSKTQQKAVLNMYNFSIERPKIISKKITEILSRKYLEHIPWAYQISTDEAKQLFLEMEIYRDYEDGAQGLVLSIEEIEAEPEIAYCVENDALVKRLPF